MAEVAGDLSTERSYCMEVTWKIQEFLRILANLELCLKSTSFSLDESLWRLKLDPNGFIFGDTERYIGISLFRENFSLAQQRVKATFSIENCFGGVFKSHSNITSYETFHNSVGTANLIARSQLEKGDHFLLPEGTLTVRCHITVEPSSNDSGASQDSSLETGALPCQHLDASSRTDTPDSCKGAGDLQKTSTTIHNLQSDYKKLLETEEDSDVCLKVSDKEFRAHKCILRARSSVFSAMFRHDTTEKTSGEVVIEDLDPESFPDFLQHIYSGSTNELSEENVFNLFMAADKYDMTDLKSECKDYMKSTLSLDTFCDVMIVALRYREDDLLKLAIDFFAKNLKKIIVTVKWQNFTKEFNTQANELLIKALITDGED